MLYRHLLWGWTGWWRQALQYPNCWTGNETRRSFQKSEDSLSESKDCGTPGFAWDYSKGVSVFGCCQLGCSSPSWLTLLFTPSGLVLWILARGSFSFSLLFMSHRSHRRFKFVNEIGVLDIALLPLRRWYFPSYRGCDMYHSIEKPIDSLPLIFNTIMSFCLLHTGC